jgi:hypothetical protein
MEEEYQMDPPSDPNFLWLRVLLLPPLGCEDLSDWLENPQNK